MKPERYIINSTRPGNVFSNEFILPNRFVNMAERTDIDRALVSVVLIGGNDGSVCSSYVGRVAVPGEAQELNLGEACFSKVEIYFLTSNI